MNVTAMRSITTLASLMTGDDSDRMTMTVSSTTLVGMLAGIDVKISMDRSKTNIFDSDLDVSPVTLSSDWSRVARLLLLASLAVVGSVGNAFLVNVALADLLVTGLVIPSSAIVILAGHEDSLSICRFEWTLEALCFLVTILTLATIAGENYARLCLPTEKYEALTPSRVTATIFVIWVIAGIAVGLQSSLDFGPDFCGRKFIPVVIPQVIGAFFLVLLPALLTPILYLRLVLRVRRAVRGSFKPPASFSWDYELMKTNIYSFTLFAIFWLPFGAAILASAQRRVGARIFYNLAWFALSKSCINSLVYCVFDRHFRNAYVKLFHYCCCKTTVSFSRRPRGDGSRSSGDVRLRVHIIHSYASPASCRPNVARPNGRDVYEL
ncbi:Similar to Mtnr1a: Melatonin receptor type 1A (Mus musculus) [Cotesia congregata]|uniref:Similar to Mtnr1a: Melatonin receptor type 1A (Mus musculus) n=1 Tax=Cotesia congregata TaxID=51543 RepID=A0A8J2H793_COTCN|nr:Similar to Mtnr1a: Melatonin receptor type 1A (Mus musculus) [Cotesia congregata]